MIVLALDGALGAFSAAVTVDRTPAAVTEIPGNSALEGGLAAVSAVLQQAAIEPARIERIGVGIGPGGFTGVRIAISFAKALALGWGRPIAGVDSFDALEAGSGVRKPVLTVVRGRTGVVSVRYRHAGGELRASGYVNDVLDRLGSTGIPSETVRVHGHTQDVLAALAERGWSVEPIARAVTPAALAVALLAGEREPARSVHEVRADYGELPAAKVPKL